MPAVSVLLPAYNAESTVLRSVKSILEQTWSDLELIVINDGSSDQTGAILEDIRDDRLRVVHTRNQGVAMAANSGLDYCSGRWIARMDADDVAHRTRIEKQVDWLKIHRLDVVGSKVRILDECGQPAMTLARYARWINEETVSMEEIQSLRFVEFPLVNPTLLGTRKYFELGQDDNDLPEDYDLFLRASRLGFRFGKVPEVLLDWYDSGSGLTRTHPSYSPEAFDRCRKKHLLLGPLNKARTVDLWGLGVTGKPWLIWLKKKGFHVRRCFDVNPRKIGQHIHGHLVEPVDNLHRTDHVPLLIAVGKDGARDLILPFLEQKEYRPGDSAWLVA